MHLHPVATRHGRPHKQTLSSFNFHPDWSKRNKKRTYAAQCDFVWLHVLQRLSVKMKCVKQSALTVLIIYQCKPPSGARCHPSISRVEIFIGWWLMEDAGLLRLGQTSSGWDEAWSKLKLALNTEHPNALCMRVCHGEKPTQSAQSPEETNPLTV